MGVGENRRGVWEKRRGRSLGGVWGMDGRKVGNGRELGKLMEDFHE
jgi:hypothetical protein